MPEFMFPRIAGISCIFLADSFYLTRITQISQKALAALVRPFGTFRTLPLIRGSTAVGGEGVCKYIFVSTYRMYLVYLL